MFKFCHNEKSGFTIVELLVVIVVIGILASITIVSYSGISNRANIVSIQSDLSGAAKQLKLFQIASSTGDYPTTIDCGIADSATNKCIRSSSGNSFSYIPSNGANPKTFRLTEASGAISYHVTDSIIPAVAITCPQGFIVVPGSTTYKTSDFCVMKYEAKADDNSDGVGDTNQTNGTNGWPANTYPISATRKFVSSAAGYPVTNITQVTSISSASTANFVYDCPSGCHLISEAEWLTIAQNVALVPSNWSSGVVGTGYLYIGHTDGAPGNALVADAVDTNNYSGTGQSSPSNQRRTLTLSNGEVIWDFAGNVGEWTSSQTDGVTAQRPGVVGAGLVFGEWNAINKAGTLPVNPSPSFGVPAASTWDTTNNGIGILFSDADSTGWNGFLRGGCWACGNTSGIFELYLNNHPMQTSAGIGLRIAK